MEPGRLAQHKNTENKTYTVQSVKKPPRPSSLKAANEVYWVGGEGSVMFKTVIHRQTSDNLGNGY
ncbi:unnamed protein product [Fusarium graminearum]|nr:unnamed protein product [Fusarium graminearum]